MGDAADTARMTAAEYLEWERQQEEKYELHHGEVFLMAGGSARHAYLAARCVTVLSNQLPDTCRVMTSDLRVAVSPRHRASDTCTPTPSPFARPWSSRGARTTCC
jgi:Uma2 family endonuclease